MIEIERLPCWEITDKILAAFYEVYNKLGSGFLESVYRAALVIVMTRLGLRVETRAVLPVRFDSRIIAEFRPDLVINERSLSRSRSPARSTRRIALRYLTISELPTWRSACS